MLKQNEDVNLNWVLILSFKIKFGNHKTHTALVTLFERKQLVQTLIFFGVPLTNALTGLILAFQVLCALLWEWLTLIPKATPFPQISHFAIYIAPPIINHVSKSKISWRIILYQKNFNFASLFLNFLIFFVNFSNISIYA